MLGTIFAAALLAVAQPATSDADAAGLVADIIETTGAPGAALIVVGPDGLIARAEGGVRAAGGTDPVGADDAWHIGSNGKAMTAALALKLAEEGVISLDDSVSEILSEKYRVHEDWRAVTLRDLLRHTSGAAPNPGRFTMIRFLLTGTRDEAGAPPDRRSVLKDVLKKPPPGTVGIYDYSNLGYTIAGEMLQAAAGEPYEALMRERLFAPLGMESVVFGAPKAEGGEIRGHRGTPPTPVPAGFDNPLFMSPAGTRAMPPDAYAAFLTDQLRGQMGLPGFLSPDSYEAMATPPDAGTYGLGWGVREDGTLGHSGSNTAWMATAEIDAEAGLAVAVLTNWGEVGGLSSFIDQAKAEFAEP